VPASPLRTLRDDYLAAILSGDAVRARHIVNEAVDEGMPIRELYLDVFEPVLDDVGERWAAGEINAATEHYATAVTQGILGALAPLMRVPPSSGRLAIVACAPGEQHALGAQMVADFLEAEAWEVLSLGASVPAPDLAALADAERPDVVCLSAATTQTLNGLAESLGRLGVLEARPALFVGGEICRVVDHEALTRMGADEVTESAAELVSRLNERFPPLPD
jgi:MerR family transcriptional regulator, light-induced transcriptional regulator